MVYPNGREAPLGGFPADDPTHPMYLHPSDSPGSILVSEPLNGNNYLDWSRSMNTTLLANDVTVPRPEVNDVTLSM